MSQPTAPKSGMARPMKWLIGGLAVSLALNFFVAGFVISRIGMHDRGMHDGNHHFSIRHAEQRLSRTAREHMRQIMHARHDSIQPAYERLRRARRRRS